MRTLFEVGGGVILAVVSFAIGNIMGYGEACEDCAEAASEKIKPTWYREMVRDVRERNRLFAGRP